MKLMPSVIMCLAVLFVSQGTSLASSIGQQIGASPLAFHVALTAAIVFGVLFFGSLLMQIIRQSKVNLSVSIRRQPTKGTNPPHVDPKTSVSRSLKAVDRMIDLDHDFRLRRLIAYIKKTDTPYLHLIEMAIGAAIKGHWSRWEVIRLVEELREKGYDTAGRLRAGPRDVLQRWLSRPHTADATSSKTLQTILQHLDISHSGWGLLDNDSSRFLAALGDRRIQALLAGELDVQRAACLLAMLPPTRSALLIAELPRTEATDLLCCLATQSFEYNQSTARDLIRELRERLSPAKSSQIQREGVTFFTDFLGALPRTVRDFVEDSLSHTEWSTVLSNCPAAAPRTSSYPGKKTAQKRIVLPSLSHEN